MKDLNDKRKGTNPRKIALLILNQYFKAGKSLKDTIDQYLKSYSLSALDRRFIFNMAKGTVRYFLRIDFLLSLFSDKKIKDIDFKVLNILRMGVYQLLYMDKVPPYSAVDECVKLARSNVSVSSSKFVNAVLRRLSTISNTGLFTEEEIDRSAAGEIDKISIKYSFPTWLVKYWLDCYGKKKTVLILRSLNENPHVYLRFDKDKTSDQELKKEIDIVPPSGKPLLDDAAEVSSVQNISGTDVYRNGLISVQDLSSQMAVRYFLEPGESERVLDVCAAPGGKTAYIAELVGSRGKVFSVDVNRERLKLLKSNLDRLKIKNVRVIEADAEEADFLHKSRDIGETADDFTGYFDRILIDAPCSAFGTISKNPDVKYNKTMNGIIQLSKMSYRMMVNCSRYLKAGGRLVFYTCTLSHLENQMVIEKFLKNSDSKYKIERPKIMSRFNSILRHRNKYENQGLKTCFEIMPYYFNSEGGFVCSLVKKSAK